MANAGPFQRLQRNPVKSVSLSETQYDRVKAKRPPLIVTEGEAAVIGFPLLDLLEVNYAYPDIEMFRSFPPCSKAVGLRIKPGALGLVIAFKTG
jgi:hypothetical protein